MCKSWRNSSVDNCEQDVDSPVTRKKILLSVDFVDFLEYNIGEDRDAFRAAAR